METSGHRDLGDVEWALEIISPEYAPSMPVPTRPRTVVAAANTMFAPMRARFPRRRARGNQGQGRNADTTWRAETSCSRRDRGAMRSDFAGDTAGDVVLGEEIRRPRGATGLGDEVPIGRPREVADFVGDAAVSTTR